MALARDDRYVTDAQGRALAGAQVYWCLQPASTVNNPPSPLATIYASITGGTPETQPVLTDGFGHADAYMDDTVLYTVVVWHPLFGPNPIVLPDQTIGGAGVSGNTVTAFAGIPSGTINGTNRVFTFALASAPTQLTVSLNFPLVPGVGYASSWAAGTLTITYANAPRPAAGGNPADAIYCQGIIVT